MKRVIAIHDISSVGKCSLTAAIPIISAAGVECNPLPTAILSTHTGEISGYTFTSLSDNLLPSFNHWMSLGLKFDGVYSGYLASKEQVAAVEEIINRLPGAVSVVDPAMADAGRLYVGFDNEFVGEMKRLCSKADIIIPNMTEATMLTGAEYKESYSKEEYENILKKLGKICRKAVVLTGVSLEENKTGSAVYDKCKDEIRFYQTELYPGRYYGTGDIFASVFTASVMTGSDYFRAAARATDFTSESIADTYREKTDTRFGVAFEKHLSDLTDMTEENV